MISTLNHPHPFATVFKTRTRVPKIRRKRGLSGEVQKHIHVLGHAPKQTLETFVDLGMTDGEIARYFKMEEHHVASLREAWKI